MKTTALLVLALLSLSGSALGQTLVVDFQITEDDQAAGCLGATVTGLKPNGDGFLAVRSGPGSHYAQIDALHNGDVVRPCVKRGAWWGIYYGKPRLKGWVHKNWLGDWAG